MGIESVMESFESDDLLIEQAELVARGVRCLALVGQRHGLDSVESLAIATRLERHAQLGAIPFVLALDQGYTEYGFVASAWVLDLLEWMRNPGAVPERQQHRMIGLLCGYSPQEISRFEEAGSGRRFVRLTA